MASTLPKSRQKRECIEVLAFSVASVLAGLVVNSWRQVVVASAVVPTVISIIGFIVIHDSELQRVSFIFNSAGPVYGILFYFLVSFLFCLAVTRATYFIWQKLMGKSRLIGGPNG
jgi:hypothetical protein